MVKVLHISTEKTWRGGEQQMAYLIKGSIDAGIHCAVLCRKDSVFETFCRQENIPHTSVPLSGLQLFRAARLILSNQHSFDLVHAHTGKAHSLIYIALLLGLKKPVVVSRRVDFVPGHSRLSRKKYHHPGILRYICVSDAIRNIMTKYLGSSERCVTVHSGVDIARFKSPEALPLYAPYQLPEGSRLIGNTSALADHKDYFTFFRTAKKLLELRSGLHFLIMGDGPMKEEIQEFVRHLGISENVTFAGFVHNIPQILPQLEIFLMTSKTEGLGTSILDAFAAGVPVVATRAGGIPEIIIDGQTGLLAHVGDEKKLAELVLRILDDTELRQELVNGANQKLKEFTKESMVEGTLKVYRSLLVS